MLGAGQLCVLYVPMKGFFFNFNRKDCHQIKCNIKIITQSIKRRSLNSTANTKGGTDGQTWRNLKKQIEVVSFELVSLTVFQRSFLLIVIFLIQCLPSLVYLLDKGVKHIQHMTLLLNCRPFLLTYLLQLDQFARNRPRIFEALDLTSLTCVSQCKSFCCVKAVNLVSMLWIQPTKPTFSLLTA